VFNNPVKIPQWILPSNYRTQRVLFSLCLSAQCLNAHLAEYLLTERPTVLSSVHSLHLLNAHLAELSESSVILVLLELTTEFFSMHHCAYAQCPLGRASQNSSEILSATVSLIHSLASKVFNNLEVFSLSC
jgi:hypothetical protein